MLTSSANRRYQYKALDGPRSFRLIKLRQGNRSDPLQCELKVHELHDFPCHARSRVPEFQALSYVWGSHPPVHDIQCDGSLSPITETLRRALRRLRLPDRDVFVWADAICINQLDLKERKQQVALMRIIFSRAKMVTVCLDLNGAMSTENQRRLAQELQNFDSGMEPVQTTRTSKLPIFPPPANPDRLANPAPSIEEYGDGEVLSKGQGQKVAVDDFPPQFESVLAAFFDNPWFSRIWVVQEVSESKRCRVLFGDEEIPWRKVVGLACWLLKGRGTELGGRMLQITKTNGAQNVIFMHNGTTIWAPDPIPALLQSTRDFQASDPRDKVYAVLHKPLKRVLVYTKFRFLPSVKYLQLVVQGTVLLCLLSQVFQKNPTEMAFWSMVMSVGYMAYPFVHLAKAVAWDFGQRVLNFLLTVDRVFLHEYKYSDTLQNSLSLTADYSLPVQTVYRMVAERVIERTRQLDISYPCIDSKLLQILLTV